MKLRNKRTGKIVECENIVFAHCNAYGLDWEQYTPNVNSLTELNEEWEDYKPKEPLIKDEKVRKAVRVWAEANDISPKQYYCTDVEFDRAKHRLKWIETSIEFNEYDCLGNLEDGEKYTIAELCGEEE